MTNLDATGGLRQEYQRYRRWTTAVILGATLAVAPLRPVHAQQLGLYAGWTTTSEDQGVGTVAGGELRWQRPVFRRDVALRLGARHAQRTFDYTGTLCIDNITSSYCDLQTISRTNEISAVSLGLGRNVAFAGNVQLQLFGDLLLGRIRQRELGQVTRARRAESDVLVGAQAGLDGLWWLSQQSRLGLSASASLGVMKPVNLSGCGDCWVPFTSAFATTQFMLGAVVRFNAPR